jgi:transcriptional regulator with XRE-family HTH domain
MKKKQETGIGTRLRGLRESTKLSVREFGKKYGISYSQWSDYECDRQKPNATTIEKLCGSFDVTADWIIRGVGPAQELERVKLQKEITNEGINQTVSRTQPVRKKAGKG